MSNLGVNGVITNPEWNLREPIARKGLKFFATFSSNRPLRSGHVENDLLNKINAFSQNECYLTQFQLHQSRHNKHEGHNFITSIT